MHTDTYIYGGALHVHGGLVSNNKGKEVQMNYYSVSQYLKDTYGGKGYKIALDGGFTCPTRDGSKGTGGCIFCSGRGSGEFAGDPGMSVTDQIEAGRKRLEKKIRNGKYIAYFQAYTNTYAPVERLRKLYTEAINHPDTVILSIATRPDCLPDDVLALLAELNRIKPVWVELGLQTIHEKTALYIRRGYPLSDYKEAAEKLTAAGIKVITHVILGLPGEGEDEMLETVKYVAASGSWGIKLQLLHVIEDTDLACDYRKGKFTALTLDEYTNLICKCLSVLPENMVVHRITGDGDKRTLIAPLWSADKKKVLNTLGKAIEDYEQAV